MKKGAVSLSVNFLVIIIVSMAVLSMGIYLTRQMVAKGYEMQLDLDEQTERQIWALLDDGGIVVSPVNVKEVTRGKTFAVFPVGVRNILGVETAFTMQISAANVGGCASQLGWVAVREGIISGSAMESTRNIDNQAEDIFVVGVKVPSNVPPCTYVFDTVVFSSVGGTPTSYGTPQKLYVKAR